VDPPRLLLAPQFTELEWGIRPELERWAEVIALDAPGVGEQPLPDGVAIDPERRNALSDWRQAAAERCLEEVDRRGWRRFLVVSDSHGAPTAVRLCGQRREAVAGLALGHASLSHSSEGDRPPFRGEIWDAFGQLTKQGNEAFVRYGIAQMTRGAVSNELAEQMLDRLSDMNLLTAAIEALGNDPEPIGEALGALDLPLLLAKHEGCLGRTDEGFEDIVAAFPEAETVICPEACASSPAFAEALRSFCARLSPA
jgi:pimeloyl-ACP methyl ester carboxylesterase